MSLTKPERQTKITVNQKDCGTAAQPRLSVFRSNKEIYAQIIDDVNPLVAASS